MIMYARAVDSDDDDCDACEKGRYVVDPTDSLFAECDDLVDVLYDRPALTLARIKLVEKEAVRVFAKLDAALQDDATPLKKKLCILERKDHYEYVSRGATACVKCWWVPWCLCVMLVVLSLALPFLLVVWAGYKLGKLEKSAR